MKISVQVKKIIVMMMEAECNVSESVCIAASTSELFTLYKHQLIHFTALQIGSSSSDVDEGDDGDSVMEAELGTEVSQCTCPESFTFSINFSAD